MVTVVWCGVVWCGVVCGVVWCWYLFKDGLHCLHETDQELDDSWDVDPGGEAEVEPQHRSNVEDSLGDAHHN